MLPVVALVGRPNVGKSTLFNRLTRTRDAIVADFPGLTRDRKYGQATYEGYQFIVIDTGGIEGNEQGIDVHMAKQSLQAIEEADIVLFLVDARDGVTAADIGIAEHLRRQQKDVWVVANKVDGLDADAAAADFYELGLGNVYHIAAAHGRGVSQLLARTLDPLREQYPDVVEPEPIVDENDEEGLVRQAEYYADKPIKIAIVGRPNVGKSTLTNRLLGEERVGASLAGS